MNPERWLAIPGYEGEYKVSDWGNVRSLARLVRGQHKSGTEFMRRVPPRVLRPGPGPLGHLSVVLGKSSDGRQIHQLVMLAFVGPQVLKMDVAHNDGNPGNNRLDNLRYATRSENNRDKVHHGKCRLSVAQVKRIREECKNCEIGHQRKLAKELGVSECTISSVKNGKSYEYV